MQVQSTFNMFQHLEGSADNMLSTFVQWSPAQRWPSPRRWQGSRKNGPKSSKIVKIRPKIAPKRQILALAPHYQDQTSTFTTFTRLRAGSTFNIVANICNEWSQHPTSTVATFSSTFFQKRLRGEPDVLNLHFLAKKCIGARF